MNRLNKTEAAVLHYYKFSLFLKDPFFQIIYTTKEVLVIRRIFSLVDMIANTKFSNSPNVFKIGVVQQ